MPITENLIDSFGRVRFSGFNTISLGWEDSLIPLLNRSTGNIAAAAIPAADAKECWMKLRLLICILFNFEMKIDKIKFTESTLRINMSPEINKI